MNAIHEFKIVKYFVAKLVNIPDINCVSRLAFDNFNSHGCSPRLVQRFLKLDFDPRDIRSEVQAKVVFRLMSTIGRVLDKVVILTYENEYQQPVFKYQPGKGMEYLASKKYSVS